MIRWTKKWVRGDTESVAKRLASRKAAEGTVIVSHKPGEMLRLSVILRPLNPGKPELLRLIMAFCTSEGIRRDTGIITWLRWPDKVLVSDKVVATTSMAGSSDVDPEWVVLTSCVQTARGNPADSETISLTDVLGVSIDPDLLVDRLLESLSWMYYGWTQGMVGHIIRRYRSMLDTVGKQVQFLNRGKRLTGIARDVDSMGNLVVQLQVGLESVRVEDAGKLREL